MILTTYKEGSRLSRGPRVYSVYLLKPPTTTSLLVLVAIAPVLLVPSYASVIPFSYDSAVLNEILPIPHPTKPFPTLLLSCLTFHKYIFWEHPLGHNVISLSYFFVHLEILLLNGPKWQKLSRKRKNRTRNSVVTRRGSKCLVAQPMNIVDPIFLAQSFYFCENFNLSLFRQCYEHFLQKLTPLIIGHMHVSLPLHPPLSSAKVGNKRQIFKTNTFYFFGFFITFIRGCSIIS